MFGEVSVSDNSLEQREMDEVCEDAKLQQLVFRSGINWMAVTIAYLRNSNYELHPRLVVRMNDLEDAIAEGDNATAIWQAYSDLLATAKIMGVDLLNMPFQFFGRSFH